ncbi:hypothetical protein [Haloarcula sp. Atlit-7R]|uniref:hypothetical protein n=1 Tax=Haloarcula sp. Atlit-7R TaxID=2282125 RepID=UPI001F2A55A4|nr:hypothetical protein [Haloarcula sp. Atlit-7R]
MNDSVTELINSSLFSVSGKESEYELKGVLLASVETDSSIALKSTLDLEGIKMRTGTAEANFGSQTTGE